MMRENFRSSSIETLVTEVRNAFDPNATFVQWWHQMLLLCLLYEVMVIPFLLTFKSSAADEWLTPELMAVYACELLFVFDVYVELNTGYYEDGNVTRDAKKARIKYIKSARFALDLAALPPLSLVAATKKLSFSPVFLELHKLLRVWRIPKCIAMLDDVYARYYELLKMFKVLVVTVLLSHLVACVRFSFGLDDHGHNHWLPHPPLHHELHAQSKYLMSLYWAFGLLTGLFEGELPYSIPEFVFTISVALCGFALFTYLCATFFMISKCESGHTETAEARISQFKHLLSFHRVPDTLQQHAVGYLKRYYTYSESNDREAMRLLCPSIAKDIQVALLKDMVGNIIFFQGCNEQFIVAITSLLEMISLPANFTVFHAGDLGDAMYVVNSGVLHVVVDGVKVREMRKGSFFGEMAMFLNRPRFASVVTTTYCSLYKIVRFHMERVLEGYPEYATSIPGKVEEMARVLFGPRVLLSSAKSSGSADAKTPEKKTIGKLLRKHIKLTDKSRVAPSIGTIAASALAITQAGSPPASRAKVLPAPVSTEDQPKSVRRPASPPSPTSPTGRTPPSLEDIGKVDARSRPTLSKSGSRTSRVTNAVHQLYVNTVRAILTLTLTFTQPGHSALASLFLLRKAIDVESKQRMLWILLLQVNLVYNWFVVPLQLAFELLDQSTWYLVALDTVMDVVLWADLYLNFNLVYVHDSEKIWDTVKTARRYLMSWFLLDLASLLPYKLFFTTAPHAATRIPRLVRAARLSTHFREVDDRVQLTSKQRLFLFGVLLTMMYHIIACLHFSITYLEGFSEKQDAWIPCADIDLRRLNSTHYVDDAHGGAVYADNSREVVKVGFTQYFRSLYYAANVLTALGRAIEPASDTQYAAALVFMLSGFFITAVVVDNVQKRFTASAVEQKEFFAARSRIQLFLRRQRAPLVIHKRVNAFLDFWWSAHRGAVIGELLEELPETIKRDIVKSICKPALQTLALLSGARPVLTQLEHVFVDNIKFILYGQGEVVYRQGDYASGLFFLLEGEVCVIANGGSPRSVSQGAFFGTAALRLDDTAANYSERVSAISGCILLFVSRDHLLAMNQTFAALPDAMRALEKRLMDPKLTKGAILNTGNQSKPVERHAVIDKLFGVCLDAAVVVLDPDSIRILVWETFVFVAMTAQWVVVMFHICFGIDPEQHTAADAFTVLVEVAFLVDMYVRSHLGYYEFGNKVMDLVQIKRRYYRSRELVIDALALLPFFVVNWVLESSSSRRHRWELLNLNKLIRLLKVPNQLAALENKYLKYTLELRLFKLVYYTFLLSHTFGCIWFDFASHASGVHGLFGTSPAPSFGEMKWLPPRSLEDGTPALQYFASLFWSFGLMSASSPGELPKTIGQSAFSVVTMTIGFFLFAYVVGNFLDIIDLIDAENREFYAKLGSLRHLVAHFRLPAPVQDKFKTYFFFKRFHSITQEYLLERCLPPSLLADIRMVHLQPMITKVSFLSDMKGSVTRMLVSQFSQVLVVKDEFVYKFGEEGSDMYFVFTGVLDTLLPRDEFLRVGAELHRSTFLSGDADKADDAPEEAKAHLPQPLTKLNQIGAGSYFGENALFVNSVRSSYIRAKSSCILYRLSRNSLELVFNRYPDWKQKVLRMMKVQQDQQRLNRIALEERQNVATGAEMAQEDLMNAQAQKMEEELLLFRHMRINAASRRKHSQTTRFLHTGVAHANDVDRQPDSRFKIPKALKILFEGAPAQSAIHLRWLRLMSFTTIFMAIVVPYRIAFDPLERATWLAAAVRVMEALCELLFIADMWVNWRIKGSKESMDLYEQDHREAYWKERFVWDLLAALPIDYVVSVFSLSPWCQINRCFKLRNFVHYMNELNRRSLYNEMHRLRTTALVYILVIYWSACTYFAIAIYDHFGTEWQAWLPEESLRVSTANPPSDKLTLRLLRGLFFATTAFVKKCRTFIPDSTLHFVFSIVTSFIGLLIMAFMIGDMASLFISYIGNEVEYRKNHIAVERYLSRWKITGGLKARTQSFLSSLWSSHRGIDYQSLLEEVPPSIRTESVLTIAHAPLRAFVDDVFRPICRGDNATIDSLIQAIARHLKFEGYPRGENVLVEGNIAQSMYFVVRGRLYALSRAQPNAYRSISYSKGDYFGEKGVLGYSVGVFSVRTLRACDLLSLSSEALLALLSSHPVFGVALSFADQAMQQLRAHPDPRATDTESRWGRTVLGVIRRKRDECETQSPADPALKLMNAKLCAIIDARFALTTAETAFGAFRPLLELVVPNGSLASYGATKRRSQFARANSQNPPTTIFSEGDMEQSASVGPSQSTGGAPQQGRVATPTTETPVSPGSSSRATMSAAPEPEAESPVRDLGSQVGRSDAFGSRTMGPMFSRHSPASESARESDHVPLRQATPAAMLLALASGSQGSFLGSAIRRMSEGSSELAARLAESKYNRSSQTSNTLAASTLRLDTFEDHVAIPAVLQGPNRLELCLLPGFYHRADSFRGLTSSPPPGATPQGSTTPTGSSLTPVGSSSTLLTQLRPHR